MADEQALPVSRWRSVASRSMGGTLGAAGITQLASIVSGVLVARSLGPEDRGYLALLVVVSTVCSLVGSIGLPSAVTYYVAQDPSRAREITHSLLGPGVLQVMAALVLQLAMLVALVMDDPGRVKVAGAISLLLVPGLLALFYGLAILQGRQRFTAFNLLRILPTMAYVAGVLIVFLYGAADLVLIMTMWAGANFVGGFLALGVAVLGLPAASTDDSSPSRSQMTKFGLKSFAGSLSPVEAFRLDQGVVGLFLSPVALGFYVVGQAFTALPRVIGASIGLVAYPKVAAQQDPTAARRALWRYFFFSLTVTAIVVGALELVSAQLVTFFFGTEFTEAIPIARILLLGTLFMAARRVLTDGTNGIGHPGLGTLAEVASWVVLLPTIAILLPRYGVEGVAWALTIAWGVSLVLLLVAVGATGTPLPAAVRSNMRRVRRFGSRQVRTMKRHLGTLTNTVVVFTVTGAAAARTGVGTVGRDFVARLKTWIRSYRRDALQLVAVIATSVAAGVVVAVGPSSVAVGLVVAVPALMLFAFGRFVLARKIHRDSADDVGDVVSPLGAERTVRDSPTSDGFRVARLFYYGGLVLIGFLTYRASGQVAYSDVLFLFSFLFALAELIVIRRVAPVRMPVMLLVGIGVFSLGGLLSTFESHAYVSSTAVIVRLIFLTVFWFWLGTIILTRRRYVMTAMTLWVMSAAIGGGAAVLQLVIGDVIPGSTVAWGRGTGFTTHPNELGGLTAIALVPALMLAAREGLAAWERRLSYLLLVLVGAGLILSGSVSALLAATAATFVWFALGRNSRHTTRVYGAIAISAMAVMIGQGVLGAQTPLERFDRVTNASPGASGGTGSLHSRIVTYRVAVKHIEEQPFLGVGLDLLSITKPFGIVSDEYDVHNVIIGTWYKTGLFGVVGMIIAFIAIFKTGWRAMVRSEADVERAAALALVCSVVAFIVFAMGQPVLYSRFGWISAALLLALRAVQIRAGESVGVRAHTGAMRDTGLVSVEQRS